jgi:hypothetical protein
MNGGMDERSHPHSGRSIKLRAVWGGIGMKEANPIVSLIIGFDEQKQELKQFLNEEKRFRSSVRFIVSQPDHRRIQISQKHRNVFSLSSSKASTSIMVKKSFSSARFKKKRIKEEGFGS